MTPERELRSRLLELGAHVDAQASGPFASATFVLDGLVFELTSDYGNWRLNIAIQGRSLYPASFWLAVLDGKSQVPDPPVGEEDMVRVIESLPRLLERAPDLLESVESIGEDYAASMRERLEKRSQD